jgi:hypothetical protein
MVTFASEPLEGLLPKPVVTLAIDNADGLDAAHQPNKIGQNEIDRKRVNSSPGRKFDHSLSRSSRACRTISDTQHRNKRKWKDRC